MGIQCVSQNKYLNVNYQVISNCTDLIMLDAVSC